MNIKLFAITALSAGLAVSNVYADMSNMPPEIKQQLEQQQAQELSNSQAKSTSSDSETVVVDEGGELKVVPKSSIKPAPKPIQRPILPPETQNDSTQIPIPAPPANKP